MAQYNEVEFFGQKLLSVRGDTVTPETLLAGRTAHDASGTPITGEFAVNPLTAEENGTFTPPAGSAYGPVTVNVPQTDAEPLSVTENGTYNAPEGKAYTPVTVAVPQTDTQPLTVTENGTYTAPQGAAYTPVTVNVPGTDTDDATAQAADIAAGQTAYARGDKLTGTMPNLDAISFGEGVTPPERGYTAGARYQAIAEAIEDLEANAVNVTPLAVTENGTYQATGVAYSPVEINVPQTDVEPLSVTENGTYNAPEGKAYTPVTVAVPQTDTQPLTVTENGTYTAPQGTAYTPVTVNVEQKSVTVNVRLSGITPPERSYIYFEYVSTEYHDATGYLFKRQDMVNYGSVESLSATVQLILGTPLIIYFGFYGTSATVAYNWTFSAGGNEDSNISGNKYFYVVLKGVYSDGDLTITLS